MQMGQHMKLSPRMIQSMEILQMPMLALQERIDQELESNIALEQIEHEADSDAPSTTDDDNAESLEQRELIVGEDGKDTADDWERLGELESGYQDAFDNQYSSGTFHEQEMMASATARWMPLPICPHVVKD